jgi:hypothetical protein
MPTKAKLERVEQPDLSGYLTTDHYNQLVSMINGANAAAAQAAQEASRAARAADVKYGTVSSVGQLTPGTYSHNLAAITGTSGPDWVYSMIVTSTGSTEATQGYSNTVVGNPSFSSQVFGSTGIVTITATAATGYRARQASLSYTIAVTARHP